MFSQIANKETKQHWVEIKKTESQYLSGKKRQLIVVCVDGILI
jgi:hypothetical protein